MPQATLTITYRPPTGASLTDPLWIRIEPVYPPADRATVGQAAALLDRAFGLEVCEDGGEGEELVNLNEPALDKEAFKHATAEIIDLSYCEDGWDGSLDMHLKIIRSHPDLDYTLRLVGCEQTGPAVPTSGTASLIATTADTLTLEWPVVGDLQCEPAPVDRQGNTLRFAEADQAATLRASWATVYDLVPIRVPAAAFADDRDLRALAFMHGMVADERISPEQPEQPDWSLCPTTDWQAPADDQITCYQIVRTHRLCSCSKYEMGVDEVEEIVPCPEGIHCAGNETECMHLMGTVSKTEYVDCGPTDRTGTFDGDLSDPNFYLEKCCEWPTTSLPQCARRTVNWRGGATINNGEQHYRDLYGASTRFVPLSPPGGICGEWTIEQRLMGSNCCDGVDPLVWDTDTSPETMPPSTRVLVAVLGGGRFPVTWTVRGRGFWLDPAHTTRSVIAGSQVWLYADADACGCCDITATDGCTLVQGVVRCTVGRWQVLGDFFPIYAYKPDEHGFFRQPASGYSGRITGSGDQVDGRYRLSTSGANSPGAAWRWSTWVVYAAPDGRQDHWGICAPGPSGVIYDPVVGAFELDAIHHYDSIPDYAGCETYLRTAWILDLLYVSVWVC